MRPPEARGVERLDACNPPLRSGPRCQRSIGSRRAGYLPSPHTDVAGLALIKSRSIRQTSTPPSPTSAHGRARTTPSPRGSPRPRDGLPVRAAEPPLRAPRSPATDEGPTSKSPSPVRPEGTARPNPVRLPVGREHTHPTRSERARSSVPSGSTNPLSRMARARPGVSFPSRNTGSLLGAPRRPRSATARLPWAPPPRPPADSVKRVHRRRVLVVPSATGVPGSAWGARWGASAPGGQRRPALASCPGIRRVHVVEGGLAIGPSASA